MRATHRLDRSALSAEPDGRTLEAVIGELQSEWGVPQSPQEYRITLKVADERALPGERVAVEEVREERPVRPGSGVRRERAPAAPRIAADGAEGSGAPRRKRSRRRRGRRSGSGGG